VSLGLRLLRPVLVVALATLVAAILVLYGPLDRSLVLDAYLFFVGALALLVLVGEAARAARGESGAFERALRRRSLPRARPEQLVRLESQVTLAPATAADFHFGLRPQLREAAAHRLRSGLGVELDRDPERASAALGPETWALLRPDRELPQDRFGPGVTTEELGRALDAVEAVSP
jgi:hypothetical protein